MIQNKKIMILALCLLMNSLIFSQTEIENVEITKVFETLNKCELGIGEPFNLKQVDSFEIDNEKYKGLVEVNNPLGQMRLSCRNWYSDEFKKNLLFGCGYSIYNYSINIDGTGRDGKLYVMEGLNEDVSGKLLEEFSKRLFCLKGDFKTRKIYFLVNAGNNKLVFVELERDIFERKWILEKEKCLLQ